MTLLNPAFLVSLNVRPSVDLERTVTGNSITQGGGLCAEP